MLSFRVFANKAVFSRFVNPQFNHLYNLEGHEFYKLNAKDVFSYGEPVIQSETLMFDPYLVEQNEKKARILVFFGGRFSPRKTSEYTLDFSKFYDVNPNNIIIDKNENRLTKDIQDEKGTDKKKHTQPT